MRVDAAGDDEGAAGIDHGGALRHVDAGADSGDESAFAKNVGSDARVGVDDGAAADEDGAHGWICLLYRAATARAGGGWVGAT